MIDLLTTKPAVIVQGITGRHGSFHTKNMLLSGTNIVAGVTPGKGGQSEHGIPVYNTVAEAKQQHSAEVSIVFVPPAFAKDAMLESALSGVKLIICITEGIPTHDMLAVLAEARKHDTTIIGPNCPGILIPGSASYGIIPAHIGMPGSVALVSRSGTLTYEAAASLSAAGIGQRYIVGIGGDRLRGTRFTDCLSFFEQDDSVSHIVLIGEIGGQDEQLAASYITQHSSKPVFAYVVGHSAPPDSQLGHAGAVMGSVNESAEAKTKSLQQAGAIVASSLPELIESIKRTIIV